MLVCVFFNVFVFWLSSSHALTTTHHTTTQQLGGVWESGSAYFVEGQEVTEAMPGVHAEHLKGGNNETA